MKIKQEIEWVVGELPETKSLKLVAEVVGGTSIVSIGYYDKNQRCWFRDDDRAIHGEAAAWAPVPLFQGFPSEGRKVEFTDVYRCDNPNAEEARFRRLVKAVEFVARRLSLQIGRQFADADVHERYTLSETIKRLDTIKDYILAGKEDEA